MDVQTGEETDGQTVGRTGKRTGGGQADGQADGWTSKRLVGPSNYPLVFGPVRNDSALFFADQGFFF